MGGDKQSPRAARMFGAVQGLERRLGRRVTLDELGAMVAEREGREPYAGSVVRRWLKGLSEPRGTAGWEALAAVLGVEPGYLAFGTTTAPTPAASDGGDLAGVRPSGGSVDVLPTTEAARRELAAKKRGRRRS